MAAEKEIALVKCLAKTESAETNDMVTEFGVISLRGGSGVMLSSPPPLHTTANLPRLPLQVALADLIILNKFDLVASEQKDVLTAAISDFDLLPLELGSKLCNAGYNLGIEAVCDVSIRTPDQSFAYWARLGDELV
ncbi:hypothetical protein J6590_058086 [Homalodisca vitripennis]|nr:hypothetical protein J6590_058086 [Homalodisca vitripennis]